MLQCCWIGCSISQKQFIYFAILGKYTLPWTCLYGTFDNDKKIGTFCDVNAAHKSSKVKTQTYALFAKETYVPFFNQVKRNIQLKMDGLNEDVIKMMSHAVVRLIPLCLIMISSPLLRKFDETGLKSAL